jgi:ubiquinone/menaquinone biosynthesis C-methylase UbiE
MSDSENFKAHISGVFSRASSAYDHTGPRFFSHIGRKLVEFAEIHPDARALDVACGKGAVLVPASKAVAATGQIIGIDLDEGLVEQARGEVTRLGLINIQIFQMDAETLTFPTPVSIMPFADFACSFSPTSIKPWQVSGGS